jgi:hypothetical protein
METMNSVIYENSTRFTTWLAGTSYLTHRHKVSHVKMNHRLHCGYQTKVIREVIVLLSIFLKIN